MRRYAYAPGDAYDQPPDTDPAPVPCEKCGVQCEDGWSQCPRCGYGEPDGTDEDEQAHDDATEAEANDDAR